MSRMLRVLVPLVGIALVGPKASAQVRFDHARGVYLIPVHRDDGQVVNMRVEAPNRVIAAIDVVVRAEATGMWRYHYTIQVPRRSPQALRFVDIDCPQLSAPRGLAARSGTYAEDPEFASFEESGDRWVCELTLLVGPSDSGSATLMTSYLPGVAGARLIGHVQVVWPTSDPTDETEALRPLVDSLSGRTPNGLAGHMLVVAPVYDPAVLASHPDSAFRALAVSLRKICHDTDWIRPEEQCRDLTSDLRAVGDAIGLGDDADGHESHGDRHPFAAPTPEHRSSATRHLTEFLHDLDNARGHQVTETAYGVLSILGSTLLHSLGGS